MNHTPCHLCYPNTELIQVDTEFFPFMFLLPSCVLNWVLLVWVKVQCEIVFCFFSGGKCPALFCVLSDGNYQSEGSSVILLRENECE